MRTTLLSPLAISLFLAAIGIAVAAGLVYRGDSLVVQQPDAISAPVSTVLQAHTGHDAANSAAFIEQGTLTYYTEISDRSQRVSERRLKLAADSSFARYERFTRDANESYLLDGQNLVRTTYEAETRVDVKVLDGADAATIKFQIATFGLLPILKRLSDPGTQVVYVGATSAGDRFEVKTAGGPWYFYTNPNHLIDRLEVGDLHITYGDYRTVAGVNLPCLQRVEKGDRLLYEIRFDTFDLNPVFAAGFFAQ